MLYSWSWVVLDQSTKDWSRLVLVLVFPKKAKRPDWTGLLNTRKTGSLDGLSSGKDKRGFFFLSVLQGGDISIETFMDIIHK